MKDLVEKISSYNLFNNLFPGVVFVTILGKFTTYDLVQQDIIIGLFFYYFIGLVISRVGSILIEPIFRRFIQFADYKDFISASKNDPKIETLSEVNNMYRTIISTFVCLVVAKAYNILSIKFCILSTLLPYLFIFSMIVLFVASYIKQTKYVIKRVEKNK